MMKLTAIDDLDTPSLTIYRHLRDNAFTEDNSFIADSPKVVNMLLQTPIEVRSLLATEAYYAENEHLIAPKKIPLLYVADKKLMETIVGHKVHQNVMMHGVRPAPTPLEGLGDNILMCDLISKTENVGSMARSAAALGVGSLVLPKNGPHPYGRRALRVSMGHVSMLDVHLYDDLLATIKTLRSFGYRIFAAEAARGAIPLAEVNVPTKWVLLMGNEGEGLSQEVLDACDETVQIEMVPDVKSFNVGVAAAILMYQFKHRRQTPS
jgi:TrmH family RNA methyltransferase